MQKEYKSIKQNVSISGQKLIRCTKGLLANTSISALPT